MTPDYKLPFPVDPAGLEDMAKRLLEPHVPSPTPPVSITGRLDATAILGADGTPATKTQKDWVVWYNQQRRVMAAAPDIYQAGKGNDVTLLASLQTDFRESFIVTSTRIIYNPTDLSARVTHYVDSTLRSPLIVPASGTIIIPKYFSGTGLAAVLRDPNGLRYLQAVLSTTDDARTITATLQKFAGAATIKVWTPGQNIRKSIPQRAVWFGLDSVDFRVVGNVRVDGDSGRSRGVRG